jgi:chorismate mutase
VSDITEQNNTFKRKTRTLQEREAKLQAELTQLREQARLKDQLRLKALGDTVSKLDERISALQTKRFAVFTEIGEINERLGDRSD